MIQVTFPDGKSREFPKGITGLEIAGSISKSLEKSALAVKINGELKDLTLPINDNSEIQIVTPDSADGLEVIRHDAAHVLAEAIKEVFPDAQITIGPTIENGFYYDFSYKGSVTLDDLPKLESAMRKIVARNEKIERIEMPRLEAIKHFESMGEHYKAEIIRDLPESEVITVYKQGQFMDLCRGPHSTSTGKVKAFKLMKVAGAYWRGDSKNEMLHRVYGTAWASEEQLKEYLHQLEEAERRDHRKLGKEMDLFHFQEEAPGCVFWHPKGHKLFHTLVNYMRRRQNAAGYEEIATPEVLDRAFWEASGHWEAFGHNMFTANTRDEDKHYAIKPMNCPGGVQVFKHHLRSYRELPLKLAEFGKVHRYEPSGSLHGLMRVRAFTQDDAHIFCTPEQLKDECKKLCELLLEIYKDFGFENCTVKFSDRPAKRIGSDEIWDKSEAALKEAAEFAGIKCELNSGEGAFYGPKLEFTLRDAIGREWQVGTLQVDLNLPVRLGAVYIGEDGQKHNPVMLHRAIFGSLERFTGILLEHHAGKLPLWLSPVQVAVASITNDVDGYALEVAAKLRAAGIQVVTDLENEKINYKVRKHSLTKVPYIAAVGKNEAEKGTVAVRRFGDQSQEILDINQFVDKLVNEAKAPF